MFSVRYIYKQMTPKNYSDHLMKLVLTVAFSGIIGILLTRWLEHLVDSNRTHRNNKKGKS